MNVTSLQKPDDDKPTGSIRLVLTVLFVMTGTMKLVVPMLSEASRMRCAADQKTSQ